MKRNIVYDILELKENGGYHIMDICFHATGKEGTSITVEGDSNFIEPLVDENCYTKLITVNLMLSAVFKDKMISDCKEHNANIVPITNWRVGMDEEGAYIGIYVPYGTTPIDKHKQETFNLAFDEIKRIQTIMQDKLDKLINDFIKEKEETGMERYQLIFEKNNNGTFSTDYLSFVRLSDGRTIHEQKYAIRDLLANGFEEKILDKLEPIEIPEGAKEDTFVADFFSDGKEIYDLVARFYGK